MKTMQNVNENNTHTCTRTTGKWLERMPFPVTFLSNQCQAIDTNTSEEANFHN